MRISDWSSDVCSSDLATTFASPLAAANADLDTKVDVLRLAMLQAGLAEFPPTGHVLNPIDWAEIELTKITDGSNLFVNTQNDSKQRLWGLPAEETQAMTAGNFVTGTFRLGAQVFDRQAGRVRAIGRQTGRQRERRGV